MLIPNQRDLEVNPAAGVQSPPTEVTQLLRAASEDPAGISAEQLLPMVYEQLRQMAQNQMGHERRDHTLQATALVHEAYVRLIGNDEVDWAGRRQFYHAAGEAMRRILIDHARARACLKRGGDGRRAAGKVPLGMLDLAAIPEAEQILMLEDAFACLEMEDPKAAEVVRLRFYAGLTVDQTAAALGISASTVDREWAFARVRLHRSVQDSRG